MAFQSFDYERTWWMLFQVRVVIYISLEVNAPSKLDEIIFRVTNITYHRIFNMSYTTGVTSEARTAYPSRASRYTPIFSGVHVVQSLVFCVVILLIIVLYVPLWFTDSGLHLWCPQTFLSQQIRRLMADMFRLTS